MVGQAEEFGGFAEGEFFVVFGEVGWFLVKFFEDMEFGPVADVADFEGWWYGEQAFSGILPWVVVFLVWWCIADDGFGVYDGERW